MTHTKAQLQTEPKSETYLTRPSAGQSNSYCWYPTRWKDEGIKYTHCFHLPRIPRVCVSTAVCVFTNSLLAPPAILNKVSDFLNPYFPKTEGSG